MKLRRLQKALCCKHSIYTLHMYTSLLYTCHIGFFCRVHSSLITSAPLIVFQPSHTLPLFFPLLCRPPLSCNSPHLWHPSSPSSTLLPLCVLFPPPPFSSLLSLLLRPSLPRCPHTLRVVHMCVYSSFLVSRPGGSGEREPPTSCYVCDMFRSV